MVLISQIYPNAYTNNYFGGLAHYDTTINVVNGLFVSSLLSPNSTRRSAVDSWGNPKIPSPRSVLNQSNNDLSLNPWQAVDPATNSYASLIGLPLWNVSGEGTTNFTIEYPVFETDCQWQLPGIDNLEWCRLSGTQFSNVGTQTNTTCVLNTTTGNVRGPNWNSGSFLTSAWSNDSAHSGQDGTSTSLPEYVDIIYNIPDYHKVGNISYQASRAICTIRTDHVEAEMICANGGCGVSRLRRSEKELQPDSLNPVSPLVLCTYLNLNRSAIESLTNTRLAGISGTRRHLTLISLQRRKSFTRFSNSCPTPPVLRKRVTPRGLTSFCTAKTNLSVDLWRLKLSTTGRRYPTIHSVRVSLKRSTLSGWPVNGICKSRTTPRQIDRSFTTRRQVTCWLVISRRTAVSQSRKKYTTPTLCG